MTPGPRPVIRQPPEDEDAGEYPLGQGARGPATIGGPLALKVELEGAEPGGCRCPRAARSP